MRFDFKREEKSDNKVKVFLENHNINEGLHFVSLLSSFRLFLKYLWQDKPDEV